MIIGDHFSLPPTPTSPQSDRAKRPDIYDAPLDLTSGVRTISIPTSGSLIGIQRYQSSHPPAVNHQRQPTTFSEILDANPGLRRPLARRPDVAFPFCSPIPFRAETTPPTEDSAATGDDAAPPPPPLQISPISDRKASAFYSVPRRKRVAIPPTSSLSPLHSLSSLNSPPSLPLFPPRSSVSPSKSENKFNFRFGSPIIANSVFQKAGKCQNPFGTPSPTEAASLQPPQHPVLASTACSIRSAASAITSMAPPSSRRGAALKAPPSFPTSSAHSINSLTSRFNKIQGFPVEKKKFHCGQCRYFTDRKNNLKRHIVTMHQESNKLLECCGLVFNSKASLRDHVVRCHRNGYECRYCGRNFCRKALLKRHLTVHSGQKDYCCAVCNYATSHKSNLERHRKVHQRKSPSDFRDDDRGPSNEFLRSDDEDVDEDDDDVEIDVDDCGDDDEVANPLLLSKVVESRRECFSFSSGVKLEPDAQPKFDEDRQHPRYNCIECGQPFDDRVRLQLHLTRCSKAPSFGSIASRSLSRLGFEAEKKKCFV